MPRRPATGPTRTGTLETCRDAQGRVYYRGKVRLQDGTMARIEEIPERFIHNRTLAKEYVAGAQAVEDEDHALYLEKVARQRKAEAEIAGAEGETCDAWFVRYNAYQTELGHTDAHTKASRWRKWISPRIGEKPIASITRDDVEDIRDALDRAIEAWKREGRAEDRIGGKAAMNVWSSLTSSFREATTSKRRELRVLEGKPNPCADVQPPGEAADRKPREKTFIYPKEAAALLACETIEREWREVYAVALYTYLRPGELRVLTWGDVDRDTGLVNVNKAWDYRDEKVKPPKTRNGNRDVPIEAPLRPLLRRMGEGRQGSDLVVPIMSTIPENALADTFRAHLLAAGVTRRELHTDTLAKAQANFRSCRDSGITWLAMAGVGVMKIKRRAGHDSIATSEGYVKAAEDLDGNFGEPFPPLPEALAGTVQQGSVVHDSVHETAKSAESQRRARDSNPW